MEISKSSKDSPPPLLQMNSQHQHQQEPPTNSTSSSSLSAMMHFSNQQQKQLELEQQEQQAAIERYFAARANNIIINKIESDPLASSLSDAATDVSFATSSYNKSNRQCQDELVNKNNESSTISISVTPVPNNDNEQIAQHQHQDEIRNKEQRNHQQILLDQSHHHHNNASSSFEEIPSDENDDEAEDVEEEEEVMIDKHFLESQNSNSNSNQVNNRHVLPSIRIISNANQHNNHHQIFQHDINNSNNNHNHINSNNIWKNSLGLGGGRDLINSGACANSNNNIPNSNGGSSASALSLHNTNNSNSFNLNFLNHNNSRSSIRSQQHHQHLQHSPYNLNLLNILGPIRKSRARRSIVHEHFTLNEYENRYYCRHCPKSYAKTRDSSTGSLQLHLRKQHGDILFGHSSINNSVSSPPSLSVVARPQTPSSYLQNNYPHPSSKERICDITSVSGGIDRTNVIIKSEFDSNDSEDIFLEDSDPCFQFPEVIMSNSQDSKTQGRSDEPDDRDPPPAYVKQSQSSPQSFSNASKGTSEMVRLPQDLVLGVIGGGNMAKAILFPLFELNVVNPKKVIVSGTCLTRLEVWREQGCATVTDNGKEIELICHSHINYLRKNISGFTRHFKPKSKVFLFVLSLARVIESSNVILWAVKPQMFPKVLGGIKARIGNVKMPGFCGKFHISIMAGVSLSQFDDTLASSLFHGSPANEFDLRVARVNPNMGLRVKAGCSTYCLGNSVTPHDKEVVNTLFSSTGLCLNIDESQANAYGVLTGCAIGYMFPLLEALSDGAVRVGIPRENSLKMAAQVMKGAAELILQEGTHPAILKDSVCSPGGTTIAGIAELEKNGVRNALISAVEASTKRSNELGTLAANASK